MKQKFLKEDFLRLLMLPDKEVTNLALLTRRELDWLSGKTESISKSFEYKMRSTLKKKIQTFVDMELPLLLKSGLFPTTDGFSYPFGSYYIEKEPRDEILPDDNSSLGKALKDFTVNDIMCIYYCIDF